MNYKLLLFTICVFPVVKIQAQTEDIDLYHKAYRLLNDSLIHQYFSDNKTLSRRCNQIVKIRGFKRVKISPKLQVAKKFIAIHRGFPLCDLLKKKYKYSATCNQIYMTSHKGLVKEVDDSLSKFWANYEMKSDDEIIKTIKPLLSDKKDGFQVFFSDIYQNTLAAEVKDFCNPYDQATWFGSSVSFFFVFDDQGAIKEVYSEKVIHYN